MPWLAALFAEADLSPDEVGLPAPQVKRGLRTWLELLEAASEHSADLTTGLDAVAMDSGAATAHEAADDARREATAREYEKRAAVLDRRTRVRAGLDAMLEAAPAPKVTAPESEKDGWLAAVEDLLTEDPIPAEMRRDFRRALTHRLTGQRYGYPEHVAERVAGILVPLPGDMTVEEPAA
ncbi:MAG: hypothetical protein Q8Q02_09120 [Nocardioides sp.]|nr:hypothetical protein [Nocardioides sp.]